MARSSGRLTRSARAGDNYVLSSERTCLVRQRQRPRLRQPLPVRWRSARCSRGGLCPVRDRCDSRSITPDIDACLAIAVMTLCDSATYNLRLQNRITAEMQLLLARPPRRATLSEPFRWQITHCDSPRTASSALPICRSRDADRRSDKRAVTDWQGDYFGLGRGSWVLGRWVLGRWDFENPRTTTPTTPQPNNPTPNNLKPNDQQPTITPNTNRDDPDDTQEFLKFSSARARGHLRVVRHHHA